MKKHLTPQSLAALILSAIVAAMFVAGVIIPPPGEIHDSTLEGMKYMIYLVLIFFAWDAVKSGLNAIFEHGKTKLTITQKPKPNEKD